MSDRSVGAPPVTEQPTERAYLKIILVEDESGEAVIYKAKRPSIFSRLVRRLRIRLHP